jgi:tetratricopeptide (TPR) repeat protein
VKPAVVRSSIVLALVVTFWPGVAAAQTAEPEPSQEPSPLLIQQERVSVEESEPAPESEASGEPAQAEGDRPEATGSPSEAAPEDPAERFVRANGAYEEGRYSRAVELYASLLEDGAENGRLHYNLGNAYLRNGQLGPAIASYRRALRLQPRNADAQANLAFARQSARDAIAPPEPGPLVRTFFFWHVGLSRSEAFRLGAVANLLFWLVLLLAMVRPSAELLRGVAVSLLVVTLALLGSAVARTLAPDQVAVVVPQQVDVYSGTDSEAVLRFKLHAGTELRLQEEREGWIRVQLPDGEQGWMEREFVEIVR